MKASADLYRSVVNELHIIEHTLNDTWDKLIDERSPTDLECETIYKMAMRKRFQEEPPHTLDMDPRSIHFFIRPDVSKGHTMICPNPDLARFYATQGQRPPRMEVASSTTAPTNNTRANRPRSKINNNNNNKNSTDTRNNPPGNTHHHSRATSGTYAALT